MAVTAQHEKQKALSITSSEDDPIVQFVREHLSEIRSGASYFQLRGGDGVNVVACLRMAEDPDAQTEQHQNTAPCDGK